MPKFRGFLLIALAVLYISVYIGTAHAELQKDAIAEHKIKAGENLYIIARRYNVDVRSLIRANRLKPPYVIRIGDILEIPGAPYHQVKKGETLSFIAHKYNVGLRSLVVLNKIKPPYVIRLRQKIYIPTPDGVHEGATKEQVKIIRAPLPPERKAQVSAARAPLPPQRKQVQAVQTAEVSAGRAPLPPKGRAENGGDIVRAPLPPKPRSAVSATAFDFGDDYVDNGAPFLAPVKGKIIARFGKQELGVYNDGINFAVATGKPVRSARDGEVVYSNNSLKRLGNLILVRHKHGYITAYAHNARNLVRRGDRVRRGQVIAIVGNSGNVKRPQLHFQIRRGKEILNPEKYIGGS